MKEENAIFILGTLYQFKVGNKEKYPQLESCDGFTDTTLKLMIVDDMKSSEGSIDRKGDIEAYQRQVARHEVVHAFLFESGLDCNSIVTMEWAINEEMIDWFAIQYPKIKKAFIELGIE